MTQAEAIAKELVGAVAHVLNGGGSATVKLNGPHGMEDGAVVLIFPGPVGCIIDEALDQLYARLGWRVSKKGHAGVD